MRNLPTLNDIKLLHLKYAPTPEAFDLVYGHCQIVWEVAKNLLDKSNSDTIDKDLVEVGCLLHDIGVYRLYDASGKIDHSSYIKHGILGHELLENEGFDEALCRFCSCHTGVGLTQQDVIAQQLQLPIKDYLASNAEERLVMYADKFHTKTDPPKFMTIETYSRKVGRFGEDKVEKFQGLVEEFGKPHLDPLARKHKAEVI